MVTLEYQYVLRWSLNGLDKQTASCTSTRHDWLVRLAMKLAALCDTYIEYMDIKMASIDTNWLFSALPELFATTS